MTQQSHPRHTLKRMSADVHRRTDAKLGTAALSKIVPNCGGEKQVSTTKRMDKYTVAYSYNGTAPSNTKEPTNDAITPANSATL